MADDPTFDSAVTAYQQAQTVGMQLKVQYNSVVAQIADAQAQIAALQTGYIPFDDLKAAVIEYVTANGQKYGADRVAGAIKSMAKYGRLSSGQPDQNKMGTPVDFKWVSGWANGLDSMAQLCTPDKSHYFDDRALYFFFGDLVTAGLLSLMNGFQPSDFGYDKIDQSQIGPDRATRAAQTATLNAQLATLQTQKDGLAQQLAQLGVTVS